MSKKDEIIEPIDASFEDVVDSVMGTQKPLKELDMNPKKINSLPTKSSKKELDPIQGGS